VALAAIFLGHTHQRLLNMFTATRPGWL